MIESITLTPYLRDLLLEVICERLNIVEYYEYLLNAPFTRSIRNTYTGDCPFCGASRTFAVNKVTGEYYCLDCPQKGDIFKLMCEKERLTVNRAIEVFTGCLKVAEERQLKSRYSVEVMV